MSVVVGTALVVLVGAVSIAACLAGILYLSGYPVSVGGALSALASAAVVLVVGGTLFTAGDAMDTLLNREGRTRGEVGGAAIGLAALVLAAVALALITRHWAAVMFLPLLGVALVLPIFGYRLGPSEEPTDWI